MDKAQRADDGKKAGSPRAPRLEPAGPSPASRCQSGLLSLSGDGALDIHANTGHPSPEAHLAAALKGYGTRAAGLLPAGLTLPPSGPRTPSSYGQGKKSCSRP